MKILIYIVAGGLAYTIGCIFYALDKMPYNHFIWHLFVIAGSVLHYIAIFLGYYIYNFKVKSIYILVHI